MVLLQQQQYQKEIIPLYSSLEQVYPAQDVANERKRYETITKCFEKKFGGKPQAYARAPGRVNLIGEHIDYEGFGCIPMALKTDTIVAIKATSSQKLEIANVEEKHDLVTFSCDSKQAVNIEHHTWANYVLAAYKGVHAYFEKQGLAVKDSGFQLVVYGNVPLGSGLSSSAAIVCANALAFLALYLPNYLGNEYKLDLTQSKDGNWPLPKKNEIAQFTALSERYVGAMSGGMDQAISLMGELMVAKLIEFNPIRGQDVVLPQGASFVVANCLAESKKAETGAARYNMRVLENRLGAIIMARKLGVGKEAALNIQTLSDVEHILNEHTSGSDKSKAQINLVKQLLHPGLYTQEEVEQIIETSVDGLYKDDPVQSRSIPIAKENGGYKLLDRVYHGFTEKARVFQFQNVCNETKQKASSPESSKAALIALGELMNESHESLKVKYECSIDELEELIAVQRSAGALGSRITGAGWGGCTVSLVLDDNVDKFLKVVAEQYFSKRIKSGKISQSQLQECLFASKPSSGGAILYLKDL